MISSYLTGLLGIAAVLLLWVSVQVAWRRSFPGVSGDPDVLAARPGCDGCDRIETCAPPETVDPPMAKERT